MPADSVSEFMDQIVLDRILKIIGAHTLAAYFAAASLFTNRATMAEAIKDFADNRGNVEPKVLLAMFGFLRDGSRGAKRGAFLDMLDNDLDNPNWGRTATIGRDFRIVAAFALFRLLTNDDSDLRAFCIDPPTARRSRTRNRAK